MGDHVKTKSMCCSYNSDFKSLVIKYVKEITTKPWFGNSVLCNRLYTPGIKQKDY